MSMEIPRELVEQFARCNGVSSLASSYTDGSITQ